MKYNNYHYFEFELDDLEEYLSESLSKVQNVIKQSGGNIYNPNLQEILKHIYNKRKPVEPIFHSYEEKEFEIAEKPKQPILQEISNKLSFNIEKPLLKTEQYPSKPFDKHPKYGLKALYSLGCIILMVLIIANIEPKNWPEIVRAFLVPLSVVPWILFLWFCYKMESYEKTMQLWENNCKKIDEKNKETEKQYKIDLKEWENKLDKYEKRQIKINHLIELNKMKQEEYKFALKEWETEKKAYFEEIDTLFNNYKNHKEDGILFLLKNALDLALPYKSYVFKQEYDAQYLDETKHLALNCFLPDISDLLYPEKEIKKIYDTFIYQIIFSIINAIFTFDTICATQTLTINGYIKTIDRAIGKEKTICICSLQITRNEFNELNLSLIDAKQCFKKLKGVSATSLKTYTPVAPIINFNKNDKRFVDSYSVINNLDSGTNLAIMDWQDFENLIRELFEWKFNKNGGECKITQASRDGGVDAIAFDPDPILGGKIIIQAKRYTNVVGVSAVRDLYGTLINEGASKGILITTSDYGSDAYKFAKGKPITLLNGNNLLHLLNEMGTKAYIDIKEAKKLLKN